MLAASVWLVHTFSVFRRQWLKAYDFVAQEIPTIKSVWAGGCAGVFWFCFVGTVYSITWNSFLPFSYF